MQTHGSKCTDRSALIDSAFNAKLSEWFLWGTLIRGENAVAIIGVHSINLDPRLLGFPERLRKKRPNMSAKPTTPPEKMMFQLTLRRRGVSDQAVLRAMEEVPREAFVEEADRADAYRDSALGIACGQTISQPFVVAYMTEQLKLAKTHRVLEIGTGSGYQAAILSRLAGQVVTIERFRTLADSARARLEALGYRNVEVMLGDGFAVPEQLGQFDRIIVTAAMTKLPEELKQRLAPDGILIAPIGPHHGVQTLVRVVRTEAGFDRKGLVDVRFVPALPGTAREL
jgi:protein-L-isoaspartate(D-aspartate) O-methyltransferase